MKLFLTSILLILSTQLFSQTKYEHFDSIVNNTMLEHECDYSDDDCYAEIKKAREEINISALPFYVYQKYMHMIGDELFPYQKEIDEICYRLNITILDQTIYCMVDDSSPLDYCYNKYLTKDLKRRRGKDILDSIHVKAIRLHLTNYPKRPLNVPEQLLPFDFSKYHQAPYCKKYNHKNKDTLFLPSNITYKEKAYTYNGKNFQTKESFWIKALVNKNNSIEKISIISRSQREDTTLNGNILKIETLLKEAFINRYPKWKSAKFLGENVKEEIFIPFTLIQHNSKLD